jgi:hypothetical protein
MYFNKLTMKLNGFLLVLYLQQKFEPRPDIKYPPNGGGERKTIIGIIIL